VDPWSDESVVPPPLSRGVRAVLVTLAVVAIGAFWWGTQHAAHDIGHPSLCRYSEAREGVPGLETLGITRGDRVADDWTPPRRDIEVRRAASEQPHGTVLDASWCLAKDREHLVVVIDR
jgi:hypothetical protein